MRGSDIVITNPPFSLLREWIDLCVKEKKDFVLLGNQASLGYKEIFPMIQDELIRVGYNYGAQSFKVPRDFPEKKKVYYELDGTKYYKLGNICWLTTLPVKKNNLLNLKKDYKIDDYIKYDNYDAINIDRLCDIPIDYKGVMGVPLTYANKHDKDKFKIVGFRKGNDGKDLRYKKNGEFIEPFGRILIKRIS